MAKGQEAAMIVQNFLKEINSTTSFLKTIIPCIIPNKDEDKEILQQGLNAIVQIDQAIKDCDGDLAELDEIIDVDKVVKDYPKIKQLFSAINNGADADAVFEGGDFDEP